MNKKAKHIIRIIGVLFLVVGGVGFLASLVTSLFGSHLRILDSFEFPLGDLRGIAVDTEGNIYCGLRFYSRIQVYDAKGQFLYGKFIDSSGGAFRIRINEDDQLEVATARTDKLFLFKKDGTLVRELSQVGHYFSDFGSTGETLFYDEKEHTTYFRKGLMLDDYIVKRASSGRETIIIRTPFHKWLFRGPLPALFFFMIGGALSAYARRYVEKG